MRAIVAVAVACLSIVSLSHADDARASIRKELSILPQELVPALKALSRDAQIHLVYLAEDVRDRRTVGVAGTLSIDEALQRILSGTGLTFRYIDEQTISILPVAASGSNANGAKNVAPPQTTSTGHGVSGARMASGPHDETSLWARFRLAQSDTSSRARSSPATGEEDARDSGKAREGEAIETILVTAQKREERLRDVPISITAISGENLIRAGVFNTQELPITTPGLTISNVGVLSTVNIRGVASSLQGIATDPALAIYVDGVYQTRFEAALFEMMDIKDVQVLKGPQVALYGRNALAGAILFTTNEPSNRFGGRFSAQLGSRDLVRVNGAIDIPLSTDKLLLRVAGMGISQHGYMKNIVNPTDRPGSVDTRAGRITLKYLPVDGLDITLRGSRDVQDGGVNAVKSTNGPALGSIYNLPSAYEIAADQPTHMPQDSDKWSLTANWALAGAKLTSITAYNEADFGPLNQDFDVTELPLIHIGVSGQPQLGLVQDTKTWTHETYIAGKSDHFDWLVGGVYLREKGEYNGADEIFPSPQSDGIVFFPARAETVAYGGYGQLGYQLFDAVKLTAGVRYSYESREAERTNFGAQAPTVPLQLDEDDWNSVTPSFSASYHVNPNNMIYATFSRGFKSGSFDQFSTDPAIDPERMKNFEIGAKSSWLDGRLETELSAYRYDYKDQQVSILSPLGFSIFENAGSSRGEGIEASVHMLPITGLRLDVGLAFQDAKFEEYQTREFDANFIPQPVNYAGNRSAQTPRFAGSVGASYTRRLQNWGAATFRADYYRSDSTFANAANSLEIPSYSLVNARISFVSSESGLELSAFGKNLTDEVIYTTMAAIGGSVSATVRPPRTYGVELSFDF